jgi:hypothetical protein
VYSTGSRAAALGYHTAMCRNHHRNLITTKRANKEHQSRPKPGNRHKAVVGGPKGPIAKQPVNNNYDHPGCHMLAGRPTRCDLITTEAATLLL